jgi:serine/threonine protein kinase
MKTSSSCKQAFDQETDTNEFILYLLFPWAPNTLRDWLRHDGTPSFPASLRDSSSRSLPLSREKFTYDTICGLISAVSYLHREIDGEATAHHDLKPTNILFSETDQIFKICDFGTSKLRREDEGSATSGIIGTPEYLAPEYYDYQGRKARKAHGRSFDLYPVGCMTLLLATILVYNWEDGMVKQFEIRRLNNKKCRLELKDEDDEWSAVEDKSFHNNPGIVEEWMEELISESSKQGLFYNGSIQRTHRLGQTPAESYWKRKTVCLGAGAGLATVTTSRNGLWGIRSLCRTSRTTSSQKLQGG